MMIDTMSDGKNKLSLHFIQIERHKMHLLGWTLRTDGGS